MINVHWSLVNWSLVNLKAYQCSNQAQNWNMEGM